MRWFIVELVLIPLIVHAFVRKPAVCDYCRFFSCFPARFASVCYLVLFAKGVLVHEPNENL